MRFTPHEIRLMAALAVCDERTVRRWLHGLEVRSTSRARIERAVREIDNERRRNGTTGN